MSLAPVVAQRRGCIVAACPGGRNQTALRIVQEAKDQLVEVTLLKRPFLLSAMAAAFTWGCTVVSAPSAAPSAVPSAASSAAPSSAIVGDGIPVCDTIPITTAPEDAFRDSPIYVANEMPTEEIKAWAQTKPGFEDLWIDRDHGGWVVVAFSTDAAARQAELANALPGIGVVAVQVDWKRADLERLQQ